MTLKKKKDFLIRASFHVFPEQSTNNAIYFAWITLKLVIKNKKNTKRKLKIL